MASTSVSDDEHLDYVVILEFKTTCWDKGMEPLPRLQEIIEFPALLVDTCSGEIVSEFHEFVKPNIHRRLSKFCKHLSSLHQDTIDDSSPLIDVIGRHIDWLKKNGLEITPGDGGKKFSYMTCGDENLKILPKQLNFHGPMWMCLMLPCFQRSLDIQIIFADLVVFELGISKMLKKLSLSYRGQPHSGMDACRNMQRILDQLIKRGWKATFSND